MRTTVATVIWLALLCAAGCGSDSDGNPGGLGGGGGGGAAGLGGDAGAGAAGAGGGAASGGVSGAMSGGAGGMSGGMSGGSGGCDGMPSACDGGNMCPVGCSEHGTCEAGQCACDVGYDGDACAECADGFHEDDAGACISDLCDPDPCAGSGATCDPETGMCCQDACTEGEVMCADDALSTCAAAAGCAAWQEAPCEDGGCLCPSGDPGVLIQQWDGGNGGQGHAVVVHDGLIVTAGPFGGTLAGQMLAGNTDMMVRAQVVGGSAISDAWGLQFGTTGSDVARGLAFNEDDELFVAGEMSGSYSDSEHAGAQDGVLTKWNADRTLAWHDQWGTSDTDRAYAVALSDSGEIYVAGQSRGDLVQPSGGAEDVVVRKLSASGDELWTRQWGGEDRDFATSIVVSGTDIFFGGALDGDAFVRKIDADGDELWTATWAGGQSETVWGIAALDDGGVFVAGQTSSNLGGVGGAFVSRVDADGDVLWTEQFGAVMSDFARGVVRGGDGDLYIVGEVNAELVPGNHAGGDDIFVQRRTPDGDVVWTKQIGTPSHERGHAIAVAPDGTVYASGFTQGNYPGYAGGPENLVLIRIAQ